MADLHHRGDIEGGLGHQVGQRLLVEEPLTGEPRGVHHAGYLDPTSGKLAPVIRTVCREWSTAFVEADIVA